MTTNVTLTTDAVTGAPDWILICDESQNLLLTNPGPAKIEFAVGAAPPDGTLVVGHLVQPNAQMGRYGTAGPVPGGKVYARIAVPAYETAVVVTVDTWT